jgi:regulator of ribonuclease activity B
MSEKKPKIGDIYEIKTPAGLSYVQYTHDGRNMAQLVRVLPGLFSTRPTDFAELARQKELYFVFYTLIYALRDHNAEVVSHQPVPEWAQPYPLMRWCGARDPSGKPIAWKFFSASSPLTVETHQRTPIIHNLTPEQQGLSIHQLWPHPVMVKEVARGWTPERAEELRLQDVAEGQAKKRIASSAAEKSAELMKHYLYFSKKPNAEAAGEQLRNRGFSVEVRKAADGENWLALATKTPPNAGEQMESLRDEMETLAEQFSGEYDGWEATAESLGGSAKHDQRVN